jgi:hypothetical protein
LQQNEKKKMTTILLSSPSSLQQKKKQEGRHLFHCSKTKTKEGDNNVLPLPSLLQQN